MIHLKEKPYIEANIYPAANRHYSVLPDPETIGVSILQFPFLKPRILVKEFQDVRIGTPLFHDKKNPGIKVLSVAGGRIKAIKKGNRRRVEEIVIERSSDEDPVLFQSISSEELAGMTRQQVIGAMMERGLWPALKQFPFLEVARQDESFPLVIISLQSSDVFAPLPGVVLSSVESTQDFLYGLTILKKLSDRLIITCPALEMPDIGDIQKVVTHVTGAKHPRTDPGVILYQVKTRVEENAACCIDPQDVIMTGSFFRTGRMPVQKMFRVTHDPTGFCEHFYTRQGAPASHFIKPLSAGPGTIIAGGPFSGRSVGMDDHVSGSLSSLLVIDDTYPEELFGFIRPGALKMTESRTFISGFLNKKTRLDATLHGEPRPCINCGYCRKKCPVDLFPQFIMKAFLAKDMEEVAGLGLLDCTECGVCTFVCPSNIELSDMFKHAKLIYFKDRVPA